jgi:ATP-dependent exoDNAse (exonuclease V) beta subunit
MNFQDVMFLEKSFEGVIFSERDHSYKINGKLASKSVTQLLKKYETPFNVQETAKIVAAKQGVLVSDIIHLWDFKREYACFKGTLFHTYVENFLQKKRTPLNKIEIENFIKKYDEYTTTEDLYNDVARYISNFHSFYEWWKEDHVLIRPELVVGDAATGVCGCVDNLSLNFKSGELVIFDYKSNKEIKTKSKDKLLGLLSHLEANTVVKYSLQMALYSEIIERNSKFKISTNKIVWVGGSSYELIPCMDLREEARAILNDTELKEVG